MSAGAPLSCRRAPEALRRQEAQNRETADHWDLFAAHREQVTRRVLSLAPAGAERLCVLGAGNGNDLDLAALSHRFRRIDLVDWDGDALRSGLERQSPDGPAAVRLHAGVDLGGIAALLDRWPRQPPRPGELDECLDAAARGCRDPIGAVDVVLSAGLLSQLIEAVPAALGPDHPEALPLVLAVRAAHLRLMVDLLAPGGAGLLVTEVVSTDTCPGLEVVPPGLLDAALRQLLRDGNFFTGLNPFAVAAALRAEPRLADAAAQVRLSSPWLWRLSGERSYLAYALSFRTAGENRPAEHEGRGRIGPRNTRKGAKAGPCLVARARGMTRALGATARPAWR